MTCKVLRIVADNKVESFMTLDPVSIPRVNDIINVFNNRFRVTQVEWVPMNGEVLVFVEDIPVTPAEGK